MAETSVTSVIKGQPNVESENEICHEEYKQYGQEYKDLLKSLRREKGWAFPNIYLHEDMWYATRSDHHPLLISNAHELVPFIELNYYANNNQIPDLSNLPEPRIFCTRVPFHSLPDSITKSKCKMIYICRNPFDQFVSLWLSMNKIAPPSLPKLSCEEAFERCCIGVHEAGPFWTHMLGYWRESRKTPSKDLFLKYEDLKGDIEFHLLKGAAEFLECPFTSDEETNRVIKNIAELCSFEKMKEV
ncbi:cytosolic sulfotransferase 14-like [Neltuma alba]|uniref:cytosolic sulfotransferase 14-like n=1 Tax=Neltuma alba TaxID=207710 RepID=UPI0010A30E64|nr:cytosolic sulfotransferase 14-like [Prosopis alba]